MNGNSFIMILIFLKAGADKMQGREKRRRETPGDATDAIRHAQ
jgi:hypothetical protein